MSELIGGHRKSAAGEANRPDARMFDPKPVDYDGPIAQIEAGDPAMV